LATLAWTFGFDTVYAMSDRQDDARLGLRSSALTLGSAAPVWVATCYGITAAGLAAAAVLRGLAAPPFWLAWLVGSAGMLREAWLLGRPDLPRSAYGQHFSRQVQLGALLLLGLVLSAGP
jgi:4-hydroxybenzoate polyprenyltransferase